MTFDPQSLFGVQNVPGIGYVQPGMGDAALAGEDSVMMISGAGGIGDGAGGAGGMLQPSSAPALLDVLRQDVQFLGITLPLWVWLAVLVSGVGVAGWYFFKKGKK